MLDEDLRKQERIEEAKAQERDDLRTATLESKLSLALKEAEKIPRLEAQNGMLTQQIADLELQLSQAYHDTAHCQRLERQVAELEKTAEAAKADIHPWTLFRQRVVDEDTLLSLSECNARKIVGFTLQSLKIPVCNLGESALLG